MSYLQLDSTNTKGEIKMISQKIDDRYFIVNEHDVMKLHRFNDKWCCDCQSFIYNHDYGKKGDCKHILCVKKECNEQ